MTGMAGHCRYEEDGFAAAYALGLLDGAESAEYAAHLVTCPICPTEVAACLAASSDLALAYADIPDIASTPDARARLLAAAVAEREARATTNTAPIPASVPLRRRIPRFVPLALAAALVLFIGVGLLLRALVPGPDAPIPGPPPAVFSFGTPGGIAGQATYRADERLLHLSFQGLPPLALTQVYQLWLLRAERLDSIAVFRLSGGTGATSVTVDLAPYRAFYVTVEPAPDGSRAPTTAAIVAAALPGGAGSADGAVPPFPCATALPSCEAPQPVDGTATRTTSATPPGTAPSIRTPIDRRTATQSATPVDPTTPSPSAAPETPPPPGQRGTPAPSPVPSPTAPPPPGTAGPAPTGAPLPTAGTSAPVPSPTEPQPTPPPPTVPPAAVPSASALPTAPPPTVSPAAPTPPAVPTTQPAPPPTPTLLPRPTPSTPPAEPPGRSGTPVRP